LIWEDCHYEPTPCFAPCISGSETFGEWEGSWDSPEVRSSQLRSQAGDRVRSLINYMMMNNQVNVVGEGYDFSYSICCHSLCAFLETKPNRHHFFCNYFRIVGRAAFTGNHQWILSNNYSGDAHPPEVYNKISSSGLTKSEFDVNQDVKFLTFG
jgi:hypothetical protein